MYATISNLSNRTRGVARISLRRIPASTDESEQLCKESKGVIPRVEAQVQFGADANPQENTPTMAVAGVSSSGDPA
jgi:hypothetical protein